LQRNFARILISLIGGLVGLSFISLFSNSSVYSDAIIQAGRPIWLHPLIVIAVVLLTSFLSFLFSLRILSQVQKLLKTLEQRLNQLQMADIVFCSVGLVVGLVISYFLSALFRDLPGPLSMLLSILLYLFLGYLGARLFLKRWHELPIFAEMKRPERVLGERRSANSTERGPKSEEALLPPKLLDSSVLIDGRIVDILKTGFLEGRLIVPQFILEELQRVADSADSLKRKRGRRGLEVIAEMQRIEGIDITVGGYDNRQSDEVDMKLLKLTKQLGGKIMTNDYNLNRVAELSGVPVLNINELSNALKPVLVSGEEMSVLVTKEGKEQNQGVGYLDDGTMIVIENGRSLIGEKAVVTVTSVLQTAAGRMIFAKPKEQV